MIAQPPPQSSAPPPSEPPLRPGAGGRVGRNALGFWIEGPSGAGGDFRHPYLVTAFGVAARINRGLILANFAVEPLVGKVPIGGADKEPQPVLKLSSDMVNDAGESWVCVEVTPDAEGKLDEEGKKSKVEVVQRNHPIVMIGDTGRAPLALLFYSDGKLREVRQIAMFHFRYETSKSGAGPRKHFFL